MPGFDRRSLLEHEERADVPRVDMRAIALDVVGRQYPGRYSRGQLVRIIADANPEEKRHASSAVADLVAGGDLVVYHEPRARGRKMRVRLRYEDDHAKQRAPGNAPPTRVRVHAGAEPGDEEDRRPVPEPATGRIGKVQRFR